MHVATVVLTGLVLGGILPLSGQPSPGDAALIQRSGLIFRGTVQKTGASNVKTVASSPSTNVVRVDDLLKAPKELSSLTGRDLTVLMSSASTLKEGQQAVFYTTIWLYAENLAVKEVAVTTGQVDIQSLRSQVADSERLAAEQELAARISSAALVITGRVVNVRPLVSQRQSSRRSEHDPEFWQADVDVATIEKGPRATIGRRVVVFFAHSKDERWLLSPKFTAGQTGVFLLHTEELQTIKRPGYTALNRLDFQPSSEINLVRRLIGPGR